MSIETLRRGVRGTVVVPGDADFAAARAGLSWNARAPGRQPRVIVRAACVEDVQQAVRFAAAHDLTVSPRGSGHNLSGIAVQDGLVLDLAGLARVVVDPVARIAEAEPGVSNAALAATLAEHGLAFPVGHCDSVALGGYLLGGGFGWNSGEWGLACHSVESADIVGADGVLRRASATENPDLFWAVRGGGPAFFGVVTRYRLRLQPLPRAITTSVHVYPIERVRDVEAWMRATAAAGFRGLELTLKLASAPVPMGGAKVAEAIATVFADTPEQAETVLGALAATAPAGVLHVVPPMPTPIETLYALVGAGNPRGARYALDAYWAAEPDDTFVATLAERVAAAPSPATYALAVILPPPPGPLPDAAFSMAGRVFGAAYAIWHDAAEDAANVGWLRATSDAVAPWTIGHYVGEADLARPGRLERCYAPAAWERLAALRTQHDRTGLFARAPAGAEAALAAE
jgi:FAD/FMN-containing dehydrogenase